MRANRTICWVFAWFVFFAAADILGKEGAQARFDLSDVAGAGALTEGQRDAIRANGFVILPQDYRQIFQVYNELKPPFFITADSVIQAFSVILEDCIRKREAALYDDLHDAVTRLQLSVQAIRKRLDAGPATGGAEARQCEEAYEFLAGFCGTAGRLLDPAFPVDPHVADMVSREVALVEGSTEATKSSLTGRFRDYSAFGATGNDAVRRFSQRYYRCIKFIKTTGFHVESIRETLALVLWGLHGGFVHSAPRLSSFWRDVFGPSDDLDPMSYEFMLAFWTAVPERYRGESAEKATAGDLVRFAEAVRDELRKARAPRINDEDLGVEEFRDWERRTKSFRLLGPSYLPDAELLFRCVEPHLQGRELPSGLDVGVLLGSEAAGRLLANAEPESVVCRVRELTGHVQLDGEALYPRFLKILTGYLMEMRRNADLQSAFGTRAWDEKTVNTALCGWALARHAASLAGKDAKNWACASEHDLVGYVEPVPEFYLAMMELLCSFEAVLCAKEKPSARQRAAEILDLWEAIKTSGLNEPEKFLKTHPEYFDLACEVFGYGMHGSMASLRDVERYAEAGRRYLEGRGRTAEENTKAALEGKTVITADGKRFVRGWIRQGSLSGLSDEEAMQKTIDGRENGFEEYRLLIRICARLTGISFKELQKIPLNREEELFLAYYGEHLGNACFYGGNSWVRPFDDMPVTTEVFRNPLREKRLYCGIGRAKCIKVLIRNPWTGKETLYSGGLALFHEHVTADRMDDIGWRDAIGKPGGPKPPDWVWKHVRN